MHLKLLCKCYFLRNLFYLLLKGYQGLKRQSLGAATEVKSNFKKIITEQEAEVKQLELEDWVTNEILQTTVVTNLLVSITNFDSYCFTDFYIDFLLFRRPNCLYLLFLLYYYLCCFLDIFSLSSFLLFEIVIAALDIVDFECFELIMIAPLVWDNLFCFET